MSIDYTTAVIIKIVGDVKDKVVNAFDTKTPKQTVHVTGNKPRKPKKQNQSEENKITSIRKKEKRRNYEQFNQR